MSADQAPRDDAQDEADTPTTNSPAEADTGPGAGAEPVAAGVPAGDEEAPAEAPAEAGNAEEVAEHDEGEETAGDEPTPHPRPAWRTPVFAATRAVVVAAVAVAGYLLVVPQTHVDRNRLARLVVPETGIPTFPGKAPQSQSEPVGSSGIKSLAAVNKTHPDATGIWVSQWAGTGKASSDGAAVVVFATPSPADATHVLGDLRPQTVDAKSTNQNYTRSATYSTSGVPGSEGALYTNSAPQAGAPSRLASILWQQGKVVGLVEEVADAGTQQEAQSLARREGALLRSEEPGFTQKVTTYPMAATIAWAAVAAVVLVLVAGGPILVGRRRRRRAAERQAMLEAQVRGHSAIAKRRRAVPSSGGRTR